MLVLTILFGAFIAGLIYVYVVFESVSERNNTPHVRTHRSR
jgi:hypothetical protein